MYDIITFGSATQDIFIESDFAKIVSSKDKFHEEQFLAFDYGAKIEMDELSFDIGGGALNTAVNFANFGFSTATNVKIGKDMNAQAILKRIREKNISEEFLLQTDKYNTGFSVILTSFEGDRTVLAHRGANSKITVDEIPFEKLKNTKWIYVAPVSNESNSILDEVAYFAQKNNISLAFNPGTTQIKGNLERLKKIISTSEILVLNKSEASTVTGIKIQPNQDFNEKCIPEDTKEMINTLASYNPKLTVITDGGNGAYAYFENKYYYAPPYPVKVFSTLGAGDAFASTIVATIMKFGWNIEKALCYASANSASIVTTFGAQNGFKTFAELDKMLKQVADFKISKVEKVC